jgi:1,4-alpha-glucan branching enzyme
MWELWHLLVGRRPQEKNIGYAESHDQSLVGDKTIAFWLMDKEMYWHMRVDDDNLVIDRGMALHKMIRFLTLTLAGEGYLNFIGNEFGHPEWVDFPREGNNWSYKYARRQWHLADDPKLKYKYLYRFDRDMLALIKKYRVLGARDLQNLWVDELNKLVVYRKGGLIFIFSFHPGHSFPEYEIPVGEDGQYQLIFDSDEKIYGGHQRLELDCTYQTHPHPDNRTPSVTVYLPCRTVMVLKKFN